MYLHIYGRSKWSLKRTARRLNRLYKRRRTCNFSSSRGTLVWKALAGRKREGRTAVSKTQGFVNRFGGTHVGADVYGGSFELLSGRACDTPRSLYERSKIMIFQWYMCSWKRMTFQRVLPANGRGMWFTTLNQLSWSNTSLGWSLEVEDDPWMISKHVECYRILFWETASLRPWAWKWGF